MFVSSYANCLFLSKAYFSSIYTFILLLPDDDDGILFLFGFLTISKLFYPNDSSVILLVEFVLGYSRICSFDGLGILYPGFMHL